MDEDEERRLWLRVNDSFLCSDEKNNKETFMKPELLFSPWSDRGPADRSHEPLCWSLLIAPCCCHV